MSKDIGRVLELLDDTQIAQIYDSNIRKMQPADLVKRLEQEKVSTSGHMPELRGRLLRLEARQLGLENVPWYGEDEMESAKLRGMKRPTAIVNEKGTRDERGSDGTMKDRRICRVDGKSYTEQVLNGAAEALSKMLGTISENDFFDSMAVIRNAEKREEKRPKTKCYSRLSERD